jgi:hypothetical protein
VVSEGRVRSGNALPALIPLQRLRQVNACVFDVQDPVVPEAFGEAGSVQQKRAHEQRTAGL